MYKLQLTHEDGTVLVDKDVGVVILSFVEEKNVHVEARAFSDADEDLAALFMAGAIVAAQGVIGDLCKDFPGMEHLVSNIDDFCDSGAYVEHPS